MFAFDIASKIGGNLLLGGNPATFDENVSKRAFSTILRKAHIHYIR